MSVKCGKKLSPIVVIGRCFELKKIAAHMTAAALLTVVSTQLAAQTLSGNLDGRLSTGYLVGGGSSATVGETSSQSLVHNFGTSGGAGSGGGAGLGGAFFVDSGATLTVQNTDFKSNRVQGGAGGSAPALRFYDQSLNVTGQSTDLTSIQVNADLATLEFNELTGKYSFKQLAFPTEAASIVKKDSLARFDVYGANAQISRVSTGYVEFVAPIVINAADVVSLTKASRNLAGGVVASGFEVTNATTIGLSYTGTYDPVTSTMLTVTEIPNLGNLILGSRIVTNHGASISTVTGIEFYSAADDAALKAGGKLEGRVKTITVDKSIPTVNVISIDILKQPVFQAAQFYASGSTVQVTSTLGTYVPGMTVSWVENGQAKTGTIASVNGRTFTLAGGAAIAQGVVEFKAVENPIISDNVVSVPNASGKFKVGQLVYVPSEGGAAFEGTVSAINSVTNQVTITPKVMGTKLADFYNSAIGLALKLPAASVSGNTITVAFDTTKISTSETDAQRNSRIANLLNGRTVEGASFTSGTKVTGVNVGAEGAVTLTLSSAATASSVEYFKVFNPLSNGGSMNNLAVTTSTGNGNRGISANFVSSFFNDGEGVDGTNGRAAADLTAVPGTTVGSNGGDGGNGSHGHAVNAWMIYDLIASSANMRAAVLDSALATLEVVAAGVPPLVAGAAVGLPDPPDIVKAAMGMTKANIGMTFAIADLVIAVTNVAWWAAQLGQGLAGLGGAGGDGGAASGGADFFGGGTGGAGGVGGDGATPIADGGSGGSGGSGGTGGFGAGGGQGGAGGVKGANGGAVAGDPGSSGVAGFGAGQGADGDGLYGGGGSGFGGAIFVREGGSLLIQGNALFDLNYVAGGSTSSAMGTAGISAGTDLFMMKGSNVRLEPSKGKEIRFMGSIADDSAATDGGFSNAAGDGADITIGGLGGLVRFDGANTYSGHTILEGATLTAKMGVGVNDSSLLRFNGSGSTSFNSDTLAVKSTMSLASVGTFLLQEDYVRRAGMDTSETAWTGSGGFASGLQGQEVSINLGKLDENGRGQQLTWGQDGFFVNAIHGSGSSGVLTFGSEQSLGTVRFDNNVNLNSSIGRVAVYSTGKLSESYATLSGNWVDGTMMVGDSTSAYSGTLFMTGQNALDKLVVSGGVLSTYRGTVNTALPLERSIAALEEPVAGNLSQGKLFKSTADAVVLANSSLHLFGVEKLHDMFVLPAASLVLTQKLTAEGKFLNEGNLTILGTGVNALDANDQASVRDKFGYLPLDFSNWKGELAVSGNFNNSSKVSQYGKVVVEKNLTNAGAWMAIGDIMASGSIENAKEGKLAIEGGVSTTMGDVVNTGLWAQSGDLTVGSNFLNSEGGTFALTGKTMVAGNVINSGAMRNTGNLSVAGGVTNSGSLQTGNVQAGGALSNHGFWNFGSSSAVLIKADQLAGSSAGVFCVATAADENCDNGTANTLTLDIANTSTFDGVFKGNGALVKAGAAILNLSNAQAFTGGLTITDGSIDTSAGGTFANTLNVIVGANGGYIIGASDTIATLTNKGSTSVVAGMEASMTTLNNSGTLSAGGSLLNVTANVSNTSAGVMNLNAGSVTWGSLTNNGAINVASPATVIVAGAYDQNAGTLTADSNLSTGSLSGAGGTIKLNGSAVNYTVNQTTNETYTGAMTGSGIVNKMGAASLTLNGAIGSFTPSSLNIMQGDVKVDGAGILANALNVFVDSAAALFLIKGDQSINNLSGTGSLNIGSNNLVLVKGGEFSGKVTGSGVVTVSSGAFTVGEKGNLRTEGTMNVSGLNTSLNVVGSVTANGINVNDNGILRLGNGTSSSLGASITTSALTVTGGGQLTGVGSIKGAATIGVGGSIKPGNSPGVITFTDLTLGSESIAVMETAGLAGPGSAKGYDQIVVTGKLGIKAGSSLNLLKVDGFEFALGEKAKLFNFSEGNVAGNFGSVASNFTSNVIFNIATGSVVGLGSKTASQFTSAITTTPNQQAIAKTILVNDAGGVSQYYGGSLAEYLIAAMTPSSTTSVKKVYDLWSPEGYTGMVDQMKTSMLNNMNELGGYSSLVDGKVISIASFNRRGQNSDEKTGYATSQFVDSTVNVGFGYQTKVGQFSVVYGHGDGNFNSEFIKGATSMADKLSLGASFPIAQEDSLRATARLMYGNFNMSGTRTSNNGTLKFDNVGGNTMVYGAGLEYMKDYGSLKLNATTELFGMKQKMDSFSESGFSVLDAMSLHEQTSNTTSLKADVRLGYMMSQDAQGYLKLGVNHRMDDSMRSLTANVKPEAVNFSLQNPGLASTQFTVGMGTNIQWNKSTSINFDAAGGTGNAYNVDLGLKYSFN